MTDYLEAIQNPRLCFADPELQHGMPVQDRLGLPKPITGGFASVYQLKCSSSKYAVRCFLRYHPDQEQRYAVISNYLKSCRLPYMVGFDFLKQGIKVGGQWYPILKMEWVEGEQLNLFIERNLKNPALIIGTSQKFLQMVRDLKQLSIAHGDLQHGNILVVNGNFRLIDYDGMYVPGLEGMSSHEVGHLNYQHPCRTGEHFGPNLDHFSAWSIYLSLAALGADGSLWQRTGGGDECLIFRREDFERPSTSKALNMLEKIDNGAMQPLVAAFRSMLQATDLSKIPPPDGTTIVPAIPNQITTGVLPSWIKDYISLQGPSQDRPSCPTPPETSWILDHIEPLKPAGISAPCIKERLLPGIFLGLTAAYVFLGGNTSLQVLSSIIIGELALYCLLLTYWYRSQPQVAKKIILLSGRRLLKKEIKHLRSDIARLNEKSKILGLTDQQKIKEIKSKLDESRQKEKNEIDIIDLEYQTARADIKRQQQVLSREETNELTNALNNYQNEFMVTQLVQYSILKATIPGVGPELKSRLFYAGCKTAADISNIQAVNKIRGQQLRENAYIEITGRGKIHIEGIGPKKAEAILAWRKNAELKHYRQIPKSLPQAQYNLIKIKYQVKQKMLESKETKVQQDFSQRKDQLTKKFHEEQHALNKQLKNIRDKLQKANTELNDKIDDRKKDLAEREYKLTKIERDLNAYTHVNFLTYIKHVLFFQNSP
jgi:hypothetical protein